MKRKMEIRKSKLVKTTQPRMPTIRPPNSPSMPIDCPALVSRKGMIHVMTNAEFLASCSGMLLTWQLIGPAETGEVPTLESDGNLLLEEAQRMKCGKKNTTS